MGWFMNFMKSSIGKKMQMALTGILLCLFLIIHVAGNLTLFVGQEAFNAYVETLSKVKPLVRIIEVILALIFIGHIINAVILTIQNRRSTAEKYLRNKLRTKKDLFIEQNIIEFKNKKYKEYLHYVEIPGMGTVIDYDREEKYYKDLLEDNGLRLINKNNFKSDEYICTIFVFEKK